MSPGEAITSLRRLADGLEDGQELLEQYQSDELSQFCEEVEDLEAEFVQMLNQASEDEQEDEYDEGEEKDDDSVEEDEDDE